MYYDRFIPEWIKRSERIDVYVDDGDRFISLWIAFNGWLRKKHGEKLSDRVLINEALQDFDLKNMFNWLKEHDQKFETNLNILRRYTVTNMKDEANSSLYKNYNGSFKSFIDVIYQIRCNLFHGRKNISENKVDLALIKLALQLLKPLFKKYLKEREGLVY